MRIVIDMQGAQAENRNRGIGRLALSLAKSIAINKGMHEVILALNGAFPESIEIIRDEFNGILPARNIQVWQGLAGVGYSNSGGDFREKSSAIVREAFLSSLRPSIVLVMSLFEGFVDDAVTSVGNLNAAYPTAVFLHDLIPLIYRDIYLKSPLVESWYMRQLGYLRRADMLICNSDSTRREGVEIAGFDEGDVVTVYAGKGNQFRPIELSAEAKIRISTAYGLVKPFVMYGGGIDYRKNIEGLIRAFALLPEDVRNMYQLGIVCSVHDLDRARLEKLAKELELAPGQFVMTGYVPEEDLVALYNLADVFVFPSLHEGFGLPALEAMACGCAVIGANTASLPEVIGREDALFDPMSDKAIADKLVQVLTNTQFRNELKAHGISRARHFSWDKSALLTIAEIERFVADRCIMKQPKITQHLRPKLAYVSPLPPEKTGIADYSSELLRELAESYDIDVIVDQDEISDAWIGANCKIRTAEWFLANSDGYERVLYHIGNSEFHQYMFDLLRIIPGVVVLHDFFLSSIVAYMDAHGAAPGCWAHELYKAHGFSALSERFHNKDMADVVWKYPCSLSVIQGSLGIITHSANSIRLAEQWYSAELADWTIIPLLRDSRIHADKSLSRKVLGFGSGDFLVCAFGMLGPSKLNERLLRAWLKSSLALDTTCHLVFVGENHPGSYGQELLATIRESGARDNIRITGWAHQDDFRHYLAAADVGVQLRAMSRGETSAAVLDCMNYGLATIVNANGSMDDLADDATWKLPDVFSDEQLIEALEILWKDENRRQQLGHTARNVIVREHDPSLCAELYFEAVERFYRIASSEAPALPREIASVEFPFAEENLIELADAIAKTFPPRNRQRQLLVDISELVQRDAKSGIQRVVRSILMEWLRQPPAGYRVEPVYATVKQGYRYARRFTLDFLGCPDGLLQDEPIDYASGDFFLGLDLQPEVVAANRPYYQALRRQGVRVHFAVYDLLCVLLPQHFPSGAQEGFRRWLEVVAESDGAVCISKSVADELDKWVSKNELVRQRPLNIDWFHLGADVGNTVSTKGLPKNAEAVLDRIYSCTSFLMVGTLEPRKGHSQVLEAFQELWQSGQDVNLVIVGKQGWMVESLVEHLRSHRELNKRLFWLEGVSDEYLERVYAASTCLIASSYGEGFGLPLIEAAQQKLPILARDIPVFREVAGDSAYYFVADNGVELARALREWQVLYGERRIPLSDGMRVLTWKQCAEWLMKICIGKDLMTDKSTGVNHIDDHLRMQKMRRSEATFRTNDVATPKIRAL